MSRWAELAPLSPGEPAPAFTLPTRSSAPFHLNTLAGRHVLLAFLPAEAASRARALEAFSAIHAHFDDRDLVAVFVAAEGLGADAPADHLPGQCWALDADRGVARLYGAVGADGTEAPFWLLLDPLLRVLGRAAIDEPQALLARIAALHPVDTQAVAPVLIVPRVFDAGLCRRLIARHEARGGPTSGVMVDDPPDLRREILGRLDKALIPMVARAFQFSATRLERYLVTCDDDGGSGRPGPQRDNESVDTAHRRFTVAINLNAGDHDGGDLRFPEFGPRTYRAPTGGAVVFCCGLQHETTPVTRGRRYAFLPFLYDEAGQRLREQNLALRAGTGEAQAPGAR